MMRRHRVFLICTVGLCVISFLHYYKALHYVSLLRELSAPYPNIKSFIMVTGFFWKEGTSPLSSVTPEEGPPLSRELSDSKVRGGGGVALQPWRRPEEPQRRSSATTEVQKEVLVAWQPSIPTNPKPGQKRESAVNVVVKKQQPQQMSTPDPLGDLHRKKHELRDSGNPYFVRTKAGALCFRQGTEFAPLKDEVLKARPTANGSGQRRILQMPDESKTQGKSVEQSGPARGKPKRGKRLVKCVCRPGWHGSYCGVPTMVYHSNLPTKERLTPRDKPRRVINAINVNHEFDLLHVRFRELDQAVDLFLVCESNFTAYGERRPLQFLHLLHNGTYNYVHHKIMYIFLDHFPDGGRQDGWIADDYLRTFLTRDGLSRVKGLRHDDVFVINDADEIPAQEGILFLKLFDGWTEPFAIHMRKSLYGFFWKQLGSLEVVSGCTIGMLKDVYDSDGIRLRRREYYTMPGFRKYENDTRHILVQWSIGSPFHFAGWHCSWCFTPEGIHFKLISAQNGDFPRWGDYEDKRNLNYIRELIQTGGWFDGSVQEYPPTNPNEHMYAPKYMLDHYNHYRYLLENPYARPSKLGGA
ncbi:beta-1,4-mannosyl-glycoprotein 4-beta-N-acetylglucosaminyltransferase [Xyrauchen texanus]|uniref:beta-1,4-mannosyl-glycoprotein 4-beta-N-acetylglucosaminyltransferase n=1 Tax=Xyrauchen texanus TaxID=154827 RepID=UPI002242AC27|nr:beta-1,4-mannosyl-glycoprotein 4-beta-N-acetylglucosaminyltransferase [Xyrauchen texanus]XP_051985809.1 beta-1,4-mannosyl-glycoprotein 4-beta-N-acetylglucosaminyltransferase [Xyrauchen texanus]XP_051985810.1 beta-1,4-mannosyl-glycoprotein 4-beta-N-acetylglucosaminyltransferase [Xyrauchen texanus]